MVDGPGVRFGEQHDGLGGERKRSRQRHPQTRKTSPREMTYDLASPCADLGPWLALAFTATLHRTQARKLG